MIEHVKAMVGRRRYAIWSHPTITDIEPDKVRLESLTYAIAERQVMSSRDVILQRIRSGLSNAVAAGFGDLHEPPVPEVWPRTNPQPSTLLPQFQAELEILKGEAIHCPTMAAARRQLAQLMESAPWARIGSLDRPLARELAAEIPADRMDWVTSDWTRSRSSNFPLG